MPLRRGQLYAGRADARRTLSLAALKASRYDPSLKAAGKPTKITIIATARKLVTILDAMMKNSGYYKN